MPTGRHPLLLLLLLAPLAGCGQSLGGGGSSSTPIRVSPGTEVVACRARSDDDHRFAEIALRDRQNLGVTRVTDLAGPELHVRLAADDVQIVFARERSYHDPASRELFVATIDGSAPEQRLTQNTQRDDEPCWSPDGERVLFTSERNGSAGLWLIGRDGGSASPFLPVPAGHADGEADWHRTQNRVVFSRRDPNGHHYLCLVPGSGTGLVQLTDGGSALGDGTGDRCPTFTPAGDAVVFVRRVAAEQALLCRVTLATGDVTTLLSPTGDVALPRVLPEGDHVLFGLAEPQLGRASMRLAILPMSGGEPVLVWPDERWQLRGLDILTTAAPTPPAADPVLLDVETGAELQVAYADAVFGTAEQLREDDDFELYLLTRGTNDGRQVAGINVRYDLPVDSAEQVLELRVRARVRCSRFDTGSLLRMSVFNPSDTRFDTAVETAPTDTDEHQLEFRTSSLRHVTQEKHFRVTVVCDLAPGDPADCWIDLVEVVMVARQGD